AKRSTAGYLRCARRTPRSGVAGPALAASRRRVHRHRELRDVAAFDIRDLADALLVVFVDAQHRVERDVRPLHALELALDALLGGIHHDGRARPEHELLDLHETEQRPVADTAGVDLVNLTLVQEQDLVNRLRRHPRGSGLSEAAELSTLSPRAKAVIVGRRSASRRLGRETRVTVRATAAGARAEPSLYFVQPNLGRGFSWQR